MDDEIVQEIHDTRRRIVEECHGDLDRLIARLKAAEVNDRDRVVTLEEVRTRAEQAGSA